MSVQIAPPMSQEAAEILTRAFSPRPGAILKSVAVNETQRRLVMEFSYRGQTAVCVAVLERQRAVN